MTRSQREAPALIKARKPFQAGEMSATSHYPNGISYAPDKGWNTIMWPRVGALYIVWSFATPIAWIDEWGRAKITPQWFSMRTSRHQSLLYTLKDDAVLHGIEANWRVQDNIDAMRAADWHKARAEARAEQRRYSARQRYWTAERVAAKAAREQAKEVAALYGVKAKVALQAITQTPDEMTVEDAIASLTGVRVTRDAMEQSSSVTHA